MKVIQMTATTFANHHRNRINGIYIYIHIIYTNHQFIASQIPMITLSTRIFTIYDGDHDDDDDDDDDNCFQFLFITFRHHTVHAVHILCTVHKYPSPINLRTCYTEYCTEYFTIAFTMPLLSIKYICRERKYYSMITT